MGKPHYYAKKDKEKHSLATDEAADKMLLAGYVIVSQMDREETVIATPDDGWIEPRPTITRVFRGQTK